MIERLFNSLLKHMNIKCVYYYNSNYAEAGRVDDKFLPAWKKFITDPEADKIVVNNALLGDPLHGILKYLYINFELFDESNEFTLKYKENDVIELNTMLEHFITHHNFINFNQFDKISCLTQPFPHVIIDNFLYQDHLTRILSSINKLKDADALSNSADSADSAHSSSQNEFNQYAFNSTNYSSYLRQMFAELNTPEFIKHIEGITGVKNIVCNDLSLYGAEVHRIKSKGYSQLHTDFNTYHSSGGKLYRCVNLLLYLNPDWKPEYKGLLCLCDKNADTYTKQINPILNRCVIFNTTGSTIYGHPEPLNTPDGISSQYIMVHYYTEHISAEEKLESRDTTWYPAIDIYANPIMPLTCVSSFFLVKNKHNTKYLEWFKNTLAINCPYVFFTTKDNIDLIKSFRKNLPTYYIECEIEDFYTFKYKDRMVTHTLHCPSIELNLIWNEKIFMLQKASKINPFHSEWFNWIDAGICTYRDTPPPCKEYPNPSLIQLLPKDKFICTSSHGYNPASITKTNYEHHIAGTAYLLHQNFINKFVNIYNEFLENLVDINNIWTDQVILTHIYKNYPDLFFKMCDGSGERYGEVIRNLYG